MKVLIQKIKDKKVQVGVIGMGYVGLPLAVEIANSGIGVTGIDVVAHKVDAINRGNPTSRMFLRLRLRKT
jgi:UDP-N-acetyl-D-glucosamine dehydrogenase